MVKLSLNVNVKTVDLIDDDIIVNYELNNNGTKIVITETYDSINGKLKNEYINNKKGFYYNLNEKILSFLALSDGKYEIYKTVSNMTGKICTGVTVKKPKLDAEGKVNKNVHKPKHYMKNGMTPIYAFTNGLLSNDETIGFLKGNVIKYLIRYQEKNGIEDLYKAREYLVILIAFEKYLAAGDFSEPFKY